MTAVDKDYLFRHQFGQNLFELFFRNLQITQNSNVMGLSVSQLLQDKLASCLLLLLGDASVVVCTHIATVTIVLVFFPEISHELPAAASLIVLDIGYHCLDTLDVILLSFLVYLSGQDHLLWVYAVGKVGDVGHLALWDEVYDMPLREHLEYGV